MIVNAVAVVSALPTVIAALEGLTRICNNLGLLGRAQKRQKDETRRDETSANLETVYNPIQNMPQLVESSLENFGSVIAEASVIEIRSRLKSLKAIPGNKIDLLIHLLFCIKTKAPSTVFAIVVKYEVFSHPTTLGFVGTSTDCIEQMCKMVNRFYRGLCLVNTEKTAYVGVRNCGKFDADVEKFCSAALTALATKVCGLPEDVKIRNMAECKVVFGENMTKVLVQPKAFYNGSSEFDQIIFPILKKNNGTGRYFCNKLFPLHVAVLSVLDRRVIICLVVFKIVLFFLFYSPGKFMK